jgi:predicted transcriptional regulator
MDENTCQDCYRDLAFCEELKIESVERLDALLQVQAQVTDEKLAAVLNRTIEEWRTHVLHECSPVSLA